jgi:hypothetical protein
VTSYELLDETETGAKPVRVGISSVAMVGGEAFKCRAQIIVETKDMIRWPLGAAVEVEAVFPQQEIPLKVEVAKKGKAE